MIHIGKLVVVLVVCSALFGQVSPTKPVHDAVIGAPYSAERSMTGSTQNVKLYRDSKGRTRTDPAITAGLPVVEIDDPVAGYAYTLDAAKHVAHRRKLGPVHETHPTGQPLTPPAGARSLGVKTMQGVPVYGYAVDAVGPIEVWHSFDLDVDVLFKSGASTVQLVNITRSEPDRALFQVPADYRVVDN